MSFRCFLLGAALLVAGGGRAESDMDTAIRRVYPALVRIHVVREESEGGRLNKFRASGSGVIIRRDGYLISNHHVAGRARRLMCRLADGEEIEADLVGSDPLSDIAVIRLRLEQRRATTPLSVAEFGNSDALRVGTPVLAMGSPGGVAQSVTRGIVSNPALLLPGGLQLDGEDVGALVRWIAHDARIYPGNSGGPLVSLDGRIVGINEVGFAGLGGAIPGNLARSVADQIIRNGTVQRSWIGVTLQPRPKSFEVDRGALVASVLPESPAAAAGLRPGDLLVEFDGAPVEGRMPEDIPVFNALVMATPLGKSVELTVLRNGRPQRLSLVTRPREPAAVRDEEFRDWGLTARNITLFAAIEALRDNCDGVWVTTVRPGGPADRAEPALRPGDVIVEADGRPVRNVADLRALTRERTTGRTEPVPVVAAFERGRGRYLTVVRVGLPKPPDPPVRSRKPDFPALLQPVSHELADALGLRGTNGIRIAYVVPGRAAERAGLRAGDILLRFDGERVRAPRPEDVNEFVQMVRQYPIGRAVPLEVWRDRARVELTMTLEEAADTADEPERYEDPFLDFTVRALTMTDRAMMKIPENVVGVLVDRVAPASVAALAELRPGDLILSVDGSPTPDVSAARRAFQALSAARSRFALLLIRRGVHTRFIELEPDWSDLPPSRDASAPNQETPR